MWAKSNLHWLNCLFPLEILFLPSEANAFSIGVTVKNIRIDKGLVSVDEQPTLEEQTCSEGQPFLTITPLASLSHDSVVISNGCSSAFFIWESISLPSGKTFRALHNLLVNVKVLIITVDLCWDQFLRVGENGEEFVSLLPRRAE